MEGLRRKIEHLIRIGLLIYKRFIVSLALEISFAK
jgi:hypothetical protein